MTDTPKAGGEVTKLPQQALDAWLDYEGVEAKHEHTKLRHAFMSGYLAAPSPAPMATSGTSGWLVKRGGQWFGVTHTDWQVREALNPRLWQDNWTSDANNALRFARKADAEAMIRKEGWRNAIATEHVFLAASPTRVGDGKLRSALHSARASLLELKRDHPKWFNKHDQHALDKADAALRAFDATNT